MRFVSIDRYWTVFWRKLDHSWRKLDGLLMETGRSNDGSWTDYWRKLHVLLKETRRAIYGNWMVWIRKLDTLLTESGWAIDGKWTVYWWKEWSLLKEAVQQIFFILGAWKCDFPEFRNPRVIIFSAFWQPENTILPSREIKVSKVPSYVGAIFPHLPSFVWANYPHFVCLKMRFLPIRETNVSCYFAKRVGIF